MIVVVPDLFPFLVSCLRVVEDGKAKKKRTLEEEAKLPPNRRVTKLVVAVLTRASSRM